MKLVPEYSVNIVVCVVWNEQVQWYVTEKEEWFLNIVSFAKAFGSEPSAEDIAHTTALERGDPSFFFAQIRDFKAKREELKEWISIFKAGSEEWAEFLPSLYVNFDQKQMYNCFPEPGGMFQDHLPKNWTGAYCTFYDIEENIPFNERFWYD